MKKILMVLTIFFGTIFSGGIVYEKKLNNCTLSKNEQIIYDYSINCSKVLDAFVTYDDNILIYKISYVSKDEILVIDDLYYVKTSAIYNGCYIEKGLYQEIYINEQEKQAIVEAMALGIRTLSVDNLNNKLKRD